ncbi:MAG: 5-oxoprolinase subunit PxpA [Planctomycetes bacterium]|nr:5-oxoprolinase subunit PxpA [Planctomycetota bacterium]
MNSVDLNCDLGEGVVSDAVELALLDCVTSANIACGGHAGDAASIRRLALACVERGVGIGAHPSYPDRAGFGRDSLGMGPKDIASAVESQLRAFVCAIRDVRGARVVHIKPHGALYHDAMRNNAVADAIREAAKAALPEAMLMGQAGAPCLERWRSEGASVVSEAFADRRYEPDGSLRSRKLEGALLETVAEVAAQALSIAHDGQVRLADGSSLTIAAETICLHSDTPGAAESARQVHRVLVANGIAVRPLKWK